MIHRRGTRFAVFVYDPRLKRTVTVGIHDTEEEARRREQLARSTGFHRNAYRHAVLRLTEQLEPSRRFEINRAAARRWVRYWHRRADS